MAIDGSSEGMKCVPEGVKFVSVDRKLVLEGVKLVSVDAKLVSEGGKFTAKMI